MCAGYNVDFAAQLCILLS